jgi:anti-sigma regulatory factor (Ser/Thr protein kinase)
MSENNLRIKIETSSDKRMLRPLDLLVRNLMEQLPEASSLGNVIDNVELAFNEAFINIYNHAYKRSDKGTVFIEVILNDDSIEIRLEDSGASFDPSRVRRPNLDVPNEGGIGIWLIHQLMDQYHYTTREDGRNILSLVKHFHKSVDLNKS